MEVTGQAETVGSRRAEVAVEVDGGGGGGGGRLVAEGVGRWWRRRRRWRRRWLAVEVLQEQTVVV